MPKMKKSKERAVVVGTASYGLYFGWTDASDQDVVKDRSVRLRDARHVRSWHGKTGGITSLAAHGPCGPRGKNSLIGAPVPSALITNVANVFDCTPEAIEAFNKIEATDGAR
ncbi:MAG TPA: hypothetical protein VMY76_00550 [Gemmatimonadales bacterium]|nr:hypothetical protein [Gemmatimonadales bacterium]